MRIKLTLILWLLISNLVIKAQTNYNLDFELGSTEKLFIPEGARLKKVDPGYSFTLDNKVTKHGKHSLMLFSNANRKSPLGAVKIQIPAKFKGKIIELRGFLKTKNVSAAGFAGLYLGTEDKNGELIGENDLRLEEVYGTHDWKEYTIRLPLTDYTYWINVGGVLVGDGQIWIDNLRLYIDGKPLTEVKKRVYPPKAKRPSKYFTPTKENLLSEWKKFEKLVDTIGMKTPNFGVYAVLVYQGKIISSAENGWSDREEKLKMNDQIVHMWGSISKMFTSIAALQLVEKGKLRDEKIITSLS